MDAELRENLEAVEEFLQQGHEQSALALLSRVLNATPKPDKRDAETIKALEKIVKKNSRGYTYNLEAENKKLSAQVEKMREALKVARARLDFIEKHSCENPPRCGYESSKTRGTIDAALALPAAPATPAKEPK